MPLMPLIAPNHKKGMGFPFVFLLSLAAFLNIIFQPDVFFEGKSTTTRVVVSLVSLAVVVLSGWGAVVELRREQSEKLANETKK